MNQRQSLITLLIVFLFSLVSCQDNYIIGVPHTITWSPSAVNATEVDVVLFYGANLNSNWTLGTNVNNSGQYTVRVNLTGTTSQFDIPNYSKGQFRVKYVSGENTSYVNTTDGIISILQPVILVNEIPGRVTSSNPIDVYLNISTFLYNSLNKSLEFFAEYITLNGDEWTTSCNLNVSVDTPSPTPTPTTSGPTPTPTTSGPTLTPTTSGPTATPTTAAPTTTATPTTLVPTSSPTTAAPTTASPTTAAPTTAAPTTASPTTASPTTASPTTASPTTASPTTAAPTTASPTTAAPTTASPTTASPTTASPTTASPTTAAPTPSPIPTARPTPSPIPTARPTPSPIPTARPTPSPVPTSGPTTTPTTSSPTITPTTTPPTLVPSATTTTTASPTPTPHFIARKLLPIESVSYNDYTLVHLQIATDSAQEECNAGLYMLSVGVRNISIPDSYQYYTINAIGNSNDEKYQFLNYNPSNLTLNITVNGKSQSPVSNKTTLTAYNFSQYEDVKLSFGIDEEINDLEYFVVLYNFDEYYVLGCEARLLSQFESFGWKASTLNSTTFPPAATYLVQIYWSANQDWIDLQSNKSLYQLDPPYSIVFIISDDNIYPAVRIVDEKSPEYTAGSNSITLETSFNLSTILSAYVEQCYYANTTINSTVYPVRYCHSYTNETTNITYDEYTLDTHINIPKGLETTDSDKTNLTTLLHIYTTNCFGNSTIDTVIYINITEHSSSKNSDKLSPGAIVGIVCACVLVVGLAAWWFCMRKSTDEQYHELKN